MSGRAQADTDGQRLFAVTAPGLAPLAARELAAQGVVGEADAAGVTIECARDAADAIARANLWSRTTSRVLLRLPPFHAASFAELERRARRVEWGRYVAKGEAVRLRVRAQRSRLYHSGAIAERLLAAIDRDVGGVREAGGADEDEEGAASEQLLVVRIVSDLIEVSVDTSGTLLHRRGYRLAGAHAPLRETLAAALLLAADYDRLPGALVDPMCGAGTIAVEAALLARRIAPGIAREFRFQRWPGEGGEAARRALAAARQAALATALPSVGAPIVASDRDPIAVAAARANVARAGVAGDVTVEERALEGARLPDAPAGLVATNPPYGVRVGAARELAALYAALGGLARSAPGWRLAVLSPDARLDARLGLPTTARLRTSNGGIPVQVVVSGAGSGEPAASQQESAASQRSATRPSSRGSGRGAAGRRRPRR